MKTWRNSRLISQVLFDLISDVRIDSAQIYANLICTSPLQSPSRFSQTKVKHFIKKKKLLIFFYLINWNKLVLTGEDLDGKIKFRKSFLFFVLKPATNWKFEENELLDMLVEREDWGKLVDRSRWSWSKDVGEGGRCKKKHQNKGNLQTPRWSLALAKGQRYWKMHYAYLHVQVILGLVLFRSRSCLKILHLPSRDQLLVFRWKENGKRFEAKSNRGSADRTEFAWVRQLSYAPDFFPFFTGFSPRNDFSVFPSPPPVRRSPV